MHPATTERRRASSGSNLRPRSFGIRLSDEELALGHRVAKATGTTLAQLFRITLISEADRLGLQPQQQEPEPDDGICPGCDHRPLAHPLDLFCPVCEAEEANDAQGAF